MKRLRKLFILVLSCLTACSMCLLVACGTSNNGKLDGEISAGGNQTQTEQSKTTLQGAVDLHISTLETDLSEYDGKVVAVSGDDVFAVTLDDSKVVYGTQGVYDITYTYGELSETVKVYVYNMPTISIASEYKTSYKYSEFFAGVADGITAKDCFDNALAVRLYNDNGAENTDGSLNVGTYVMTFIAVDNAGQVAYIDKTVEITAEGEPNLDDSYSYDVISDTFVLDLAEIDYDYYIALSLNGSVIPSEYAIKEDGKIVVDGNYLYSILDADKQVDLKLMTSYGYTLSKFTLTDCAEVEFDSSELDAFCKKTYECLSNYVLPEVKLTNERQSVKPVYKLYKDGNHEVIDGLINLKKDGTYTLEVELREQKLVYTLKAFFNLGFVNGRAYTKADGITDTVRDGYELVSYTIREVNGETLLVYNANDDFDAFNEQVKNLDVKGKYLMDVNVAHEEHGSVTQTIDFTIIDENTVAVLTEKTQIDSMAVYPHNSDITTIEYVYGDIGGRSGAIKWEAKAQANYTDTIIRFSELYAEDIIDGAYFSFDLYAENPISIAWLAKSNIYLYNAINTYDAQKVRFYDADGNRIYENKGIWNGGLKAQWITIEIKVTCDWLFDSAWYGISIASSGLFGNNVYLANLKVSSTSFLSDWTMRLPTPAVSISDTGLATWGAVDYASGYEYVINDGEPITVGEDELSVQLEDGDVIKVKALGDNQTYFDSEYSESETAEIIIYHDYGVKNGQVFTKKNGFDAEINPDYVLKKLTVLRNNEELIFYEGIDFDTFNTAFKALSTKLVYTLKLETTHAKYGELTEYFDISLVDDNTVSILNTRDDVIAGNMYAYNSNVTSLTFTSENIGGRYATFKWSANQSATSSSSDITFSNKFTDVLKKGNYIVFDLYYEKPLTLTVQTGSDLYLYNDVTGYEAKGVKFYDSNGNRITSGSIWGGTFNQQWITIEVCIESDYIFNSGYRGLFVATDTLFNNNVYISNVKATTQSYLSVPALGNTEITIDETGLATWEEVENAVGYVYVINDGEEVSTTQLSVQLSDGDTIMVKAIADGVNYVDGKFTPVKQYIAPEVEPDEPEQPEVPTNYTPILVTAQDLTDGNLAPRNTEITSLTYNAGEVAGKKGVFKWTANQEANRTDTVLQFNGKYINDLVAGKYLYFDIYAEKIISLMFNESTDIYLYNNNSFVKFYNSNGKAFETSGFWSGAFNAQWITVEICLQYSDLANADGDFFMYRGISVASKGLYDNNVYIANVRVADESIIVETVPEVKEYTEILVTSTHLANGNMAPVADAQDYVSLTYVSDSIGGKSGVFKWFTNSDVKNNQAMLNFNPSFASVLTAGSYLTFELYAEKPLGVYWSGAKESYIYNQVTDIENFPSIVKLYNANGELITSGGFWNGNFNGQWITVEICLDQDMICTSSWRGLSVVNSSLYGNNVYLANVRVAQQSLFDTND